MDLHERQPVLTAGDDLGRARAAAILIHSRGATAGSILSLAPVSGAWGGTWRVDVADGAFTYAPESEDFRGCQALFRFDRSDLVLSSFLRFPGGAASGDPDVIERVRHLFFRI